MYKNLLKFLILIESVQKGLFSAPQFVVEHHRACRLNVDSPVTSEVYHLSVYKNKLTCIGALIIKEEIGVSNIIANVDLKQCPTNDTCSGTTSIEVKDICHYMEGRSLFGNRLGEKFTPAIKCPAKPNTYNYNLTINMRPFTKFPLARFRTWSKLILSDQLPHNRKRPLVCFESIVSMKD